MMTKTPYAKRLVDELVGLIRRAVEDRHVLNVLDRLEVTQEIIAALDLDVAGFAAAALEDLRAAIDLGDLGGFAGADWLARRLLERHMILALEAAGSTRDEAIAAVGAIAPPMRIARLSRGNPARFDAEGDLTNWRELQLRDFMELKEYQRLFEEPRRRGRPRTAVKTGGRQRIDIERAVAVRGMKLAGNPNHEIARQFWPDRDPHSDATRKLIERHIERANLDRAL
jgi:hypothetical protein